MDRLSVINHLIARKNLKNYLEIGVWKGDVFFKVKGSLKVAVDPFFRFDNKKKFRKIFTNPYNISNRFFQKKSDAFFEEDAAGIFGTKKIQIALVDGMHEYKHVVRDVENILDFLSDDGVIILHDCNPVQPEHGVSFDEWKNRNFEGVWNGDVWKSIVHFRNSRNDLNIFVLDCDYGLGFITKGRPDNNLSITIGPIETFTYKDLAENRENWLNLKVPDYINDFFKLKTRIH